MKGRSWGDRLLLALVPALAAAVIRLLYRLTRFEILGADKLHAFWSRGENVIVAFWHDQLLLMGKSYQGPEIRILVSASKDGELIARTIGMFGFGAVRGSSSRGGQAALRAMVELARQPIDFGITPDGPKGPRHQVKPGVVQLARLTGRPVFPLAFACSRGRRFSSWDRFLLPYPFGRGVFAFGDPLVFDRGESLEDAASRLQRAMAENEDRAQSRLEEHGVSAV